MGKIRVSRSASIKKYAMLNQVQVVRGKEIFGRVEGETFGLLGAGEEYDLLVAMVYYTAGGGRK